MPKFAPLIKVNNCEKLGANVVLHGKDFAEAKASAHEIAKENGLAYIDGYDDPAIIAGQGTMGRDFRCARNWQTDANRAAPDAGRRSRHSAGRHKWIRNRTIACR